jgi:hypothetical protein
VDEAADRPVEPVAVAHVRRVRVSFLVRESMVLAMVGDPLCDRALHGHGAEDAERPLDHGSRVEALVGEVAVEADRVPDRGEDIEDDQQDQVHPVEGDAPEEPHRRQEPERRDDDRGDRRDLAAEARPVPDGPDFHCAVHGLLHRCSDAGA